MSRFFKDALTVSIGNFSAQVISIITIPIITRLYSPEEFGAFNLFLALAMFFMPIASWRYNAAMLLPKSNVRAYALFFISLAAVVSTIVLCVISLQLAHMLNMLPEIWNDKNINLILWLLPTVVLINGVGQIGRFWCTRIGQFRTLAISRVFETLFDRGVSVIIGIAGGGEWGLFAGRLFGSIVYTLKIFFGIFRSKDKITLPVKKGSYLFLVADRYKAFPLISSWSFVLDGLGRHGPLIIMAYYYSPALLGFYALAIQILNMPMVLLGDALSNVFVKQAIKLKQDKEKLQKLIQIIIKIAIYFLFPIVLILFSRGSELFSIVFGAKWSMAGEFVGVLSIALISIFLHRVLGCLFEVYEHLKQRLFFDVLLFISRLSAAYIIASKGFSMYVLVSFLAMINLMIYLFALMYLMKLVGVTVVQIRRICIDGCIYLSPVFIVFFVDYIYPYNYIVSTLLWGTAILLSCYMIYSKEQKLFKQIR